MTALADDRLLDGRPARPVLRAARPRRRPWTSRYARGLLVSDTLVLTWAFVGAHLIWDAVPSWTALHRPFAPGWIALSAALLGVWLLLLTAGATRDHRHVGTGPTEYKRVLRTAVSLVAGIAFVGYLTGFDVPRSYVVVTVPLGTALLLASRWTWRQWLQLNRQQGRMTSDVVVVGTRDSVAGLVSRLHRGASGYRVVGAFLTRPDVETVHGVPVLGGVGSLAPQVVASGAHGVIVAASDASHPDMVRRLGWELEGHDVELIMAPGLADVAGPRVHTRPVAGLPLLHVERPSYRGSQLFAKALFDRCGAFLILLVASPVLLAVAAAVKLGDRGPVFFVQPRAGLDGRTFGMIKFRTMVVDAEARLADLRREAAESGVGNDVMFKLKDDPRITRVGGVLRRFSLDELPQLVNVLKGDMSLVGPRPPLLSEVEGYEVDARRRLLVRPGITGPWQVSGRSDLDWEETVRLDLYYVENWSLVGDLLILLRTVRAVFSSRGAY